VVAVTAGLMVAPQQAARATPPPNPSNGALTGAAAKKAQLANRVGQLAAQVADLQNEVAQRQAAAELAEQKYALAQQRLEQAKAQVAATHQRQVQAQADVDRATQEFSAFVRATYMSSPISGPASGLLTADDPTALLARSDITEYAAAHRLDVIGSLTKAKVAKTNATTAARAAEIAQAKAKDAADQARNAAEDALSAARAEQQALSNRLAATQSALASARLQLATLTNQRARYVKWQHDQAVARAKAEAARRAAEEQARRNAAANSGGNGNNWAPGPPPPSAGPSGGSWTAAAGQDAANRAMHYLGIAYAFAAGGYYGPSYGVCVSGDAWNDCHVYGFDCSGLAMYAWGPWAHWDHYAATQYSQAGSYHPGSGALMPGDLVFWSSDGTQSGIHHVAIYIGGSNVIQAPQSGDIVRVTPLWQVESGYFGATRPLT
jgi:cell wall-associated NlpC family hydrolase